MENDYVHRASQWFTVALFTIAISAAVYWSVVDPTKVWTAITSVLIVACPCALLLSVTFTHGHLLTLLAKNGLYVRGAAALESWRNVNLSIFDKTGTLTQSGKPTICFEGRSLDAHTWDALGALALESVHPYARKVGQWLDRPKVPVAQVQNVVGSGVVGTVDGVAYRLGNRAFVGLSAGYSVSEDGRLVKGVVVNTLADSQQGSAEIWCSAAGEVVGRFLLLSRYI